MPTALIITTAGINCEQELARAFELAGADARLVHLNRLVARPRLFEEFDLIGVPGGFSYGDAVAAGRIAAQLMRQRLYPSFVEAVERGVPIIAPCNGFQIAVQMGLLPGPPIGASWPRSAAAPSVALSPNASGRFIDRWVKVEIPAHTRCVWTEGIELHAHDSMLPIAHAEGRFAVGGEEQLARIDENGQIAMRYASQDNPNGSAGAVAGLCDATGLILGLMPHPERFTMWSHHPWWTRLPRERMRDDPPGLAMFRNAVSHARQVIA